MILTVVTPPTAYPVTLEEAKGHLNLFDNAWDAIVRSKIASATEYCQGRISGNRTLMPTVYDGILPGWDGAQIELPLPPLASVDSVKYFDADNAEQTLDSANYSVITPTGDPGFIEMILGETFPPTYTRPDAVTFRFTAGYATAALVPATMREAVLQMTAHLFANRTSEITGTIVAGFANGIDRLLLVNDYGAYD